MSARRISKWAGCTEAELRRRWDRSEVYLFGKVGFDILELEPLSGFWVTFGQLLTYNLYRFNRGPLRWLGLVPIGMNPRSGLWEFYHLRSATAGARADDPHAVEIPEHRADGSIEMRRDRNRVRARTRR